MQIEHRPYEGKARGWIEMQGHMFYIWFSLLENITLLTSGVLKI